MKKHDEETMLHFVKQELIKLFAWYAAIKTHFQKSMGAYGNAGKKGHKAERLWRIVI